jgi:hypothetical protein
MWIVAAVLVAGAVASLIVGGPGAMLVLLAGIPVVLACAWAATRGEPSELLPRAMLLALGSRAVLAASLHVVLVQRGTGGALFYDDAGYVLIATELSRLWHGLPVSETGQAFMNDSSFANAYVRTAAALFSVVGETVLGLKLLNTVLGVVQAAVVFRTMRNAGLPGARIAALLVLVFPSTVLWSALALKDAYAVTFMLIAIWGATEYQRGGRWWAWAATVVAMVALRDVRVYVFTILAVTWPIGLLIASKGRRRLASTGAVVIAVALLATSPASSVLLSPGVFSWTAYVRSAMGQGARSAYVEPPPVAQVVSGQRFRIEAVGRAPEPGSARQLHELPTSVQLVLEGEPLPAQPGGASRPVIAVRPGDIVAFTTGAVPRTSTAPAGSDAELPAIRLHPERINIVAELGQVPGGRGSDSFSVAQGIEANLRHLPYGVFFLATAPFPLTATSDAERALLPEMLLWYATLGLAAVGLARIARRRDLRFAYGLIVAAAIALVLSLAEGNTGTLVRHRAMIIPFTAILAADGVVALLPRLAARWPQLERAMTKAQLRASQRS